MRLHMHLLQLLYNSLIRLLDDLLTRKCDEYRRTYANILYSWGMLDQRAEILKFQSHRKDTSKDIGEDCPSQAVHTLLLPCMQWKYGCKVMLTNSMLTNFGYFSDI